MYKQRISVKAPLFGNSVLSGAKIRRDCNICSYCFIEIDVFIGDRVTIKNGVYIFDSIHIESDVFIGPNVTFTNDIYPRIQRGKNREEPSYTKTIICEGASIGGCSACTKPQATLSSLDFLMREGNTYKNV